MSLKPRRAGRNLQCADRKMNRQADVRKWTIPEHKLDIGMHRKGAAGRYALRDGESKKIRHTVATRGRTGVEEANIPGREGAERMDASEPGPH